MKALVEENEFIEIFVDTPLDICERRDPKGLYRKARKGEIANFTGISSPYEAPLNANIHLNTDEETIDECTEKIINYLEERGYLNA